MPKKINSPTTIQSAGNKPKTIIIFTATYIKKAGSKEEFMKIDHDQPIEI